MYGTDWTGERVRASIIRTFELLPGVPIYSERIGVLEGPAEGLHIIMCSSEVLGVSSQQRIRLLTWCRARAMGQSTDQVIKLMGWPKSSAMLDIAKASSLIAATLNASEVCG